MVLIILFVLPSCKKTYECTCKLKSNGQLIAAIIIEKKTKKDAKAKCAYFEDASKTMPDPVTCTLEKK